MYRKEAKEYIVTHPDVFLELDRQSQNGFIVNPTYVCPICGSGSGTNGTGMTSMDGIHFYCWSGKCFKNNDVLDIIGKVHGLKNYNDKLKKACEIYGISYSELKCDPDYRRSTTRKEVPSSHVASISTASFKKKMQVEQTDYLNYFIERAKHRHETDYLYKRGISDAVQEKYYIGYHRNWSSPTALKRGRMPIFSPRIIIPTSRYSYVACTTNPYSTKRPKIKEGQIHLFNVKSLNKLKEPVIVTEGEIDALSIIEVGHNAVGLGGTENYGMLIDHFREHRPSKPVLIALDNDSPGRGAAEKLKAGLKELEIECYDLISEINGEHKDPNERLIADRDGFRKTVDEAVTRYD